MESYTLEGEYLHLKTGGKYTVVDNGKLEKTGECMTIYVSHETGDTWIRPTLEFNDGRFRMIKDRKN